MALQAPVTCARGRATVVCRGHFPLPEPGSVPFSIPFDERNRGVQWLLRVRIVRLDQAEDEVARCVIDVRPA